MFKSNEDLFRTLYDDQQQAIYMYKIIASLKLLNANNVKIDYQLEDLMTDIDIIVMQIISERNIC